MKLKNLNQKMFTIIGLSWFGFFLIGIIINLFFTPTITVLIDRSYCPSSQWQDVVISYQELYRKYQHKSLKIKQVVVFSDLGKEVFNKPPIPNEILSLNTYGTSNQQQRQKLLAEYPKAILLACQ